MHLARWWRMQEPGWVFAHATVDLRVGGTYRLGMTDPHGVTHAAIGTYWEVNRPLRLVFSWDWERPSDSLGQTLVTLELTALETHHTQLSLTHERFIDLSRMRGHERGWTQLLNLLDELTKEPPS
jgi:uncharacterized protein YndB with AHSA1/START domain